MAPAMEPIIAPIMDPFRDQTMDPIRDQPRTLALRAQARVLARERRLRLSAQRYGQVWPAGPMGARHSHSRQF